MVVVCICVFFFEILSSNIVLMLWQNISKNIRDILAETNYNTNQSTNSQSFI